MALESASEASASEALKAADAARVEAEEKSEWNLKKLRKAIEKGKGIERDKFAFQRRVEELESDVSRLEADAATARAAESRAEATERRAADAESRAVSLASNLEAQRGGGGGANLRVGG